MAATLLDEVAAFLDTSSTLFTLGTNLGKQIMLDSLTLPNTFTSLYETAGLEGAQAFSTASNQSERVFDRPGLQVLNRSTSYATARARAQTIYDLLDGMANRKLPTSTGTLYVSISSVQAPFSMGRDANDRWLVGCNYRVERDR